MVMKTLSHPQGRISACWSTILPRLVVLGFIEVETKPLIGIDLQYKITSPPGANDEPICRLLLSQSPNFSLI